MERVAAAGTIQVGPASRSRLAEAAALAAQAWDVPPRRSLVESWLADPLVVVMIAVDEDLVARPVCGVTTATLRGGGRASSDETVVARPYRGSGIAVRLLDEMVAVLRAAAITTLSGESSARRGHELGFFLRYGFAIVGAEIARGRAGFSDGTLLYRTRLYL